MIMKDYVKMLRDADPQLTRTVIEENEYSLVPGEISGRVVIDIGANIGIFTALALQMGAKIVVAVEASKYLCEKYLFPTFNDGNVLVTNMAVAPRSGETVYLNENSSEGHVFASNDGMPCPTINLDDLLNFVNKDERLVLKMDCEGAEHGVIYSAVPETLRAFEVIHIEIHGFDYIVGKHDIADLAAYIKSVGFHEVDSKQYSAWDFDANGNKINMRDLPVCIKKFVRSSDLKKITFPEPGPIFNLEDAKVMQSENDFKVTATVCTRGRYDTTFPLCLMGIAMQDRPPDELIIYDDNPQDKRRDLREDPTYQCIFMLLTHKGIAWRVVFGTGEGQVKNHQHAYENASHPWIWRLDDDDVPESNVLSGLLSAVNSNTAAVGGRIPFVRDTVRVNKLASNKIEDIFIGINEQWFVPSVTDVDVKKVDHLNSSFIYRRAATSGYPKYLSRIGHREETILTYEMTRAGWDVLYNSNVITWHFHNPSGGIRDDSRYEMWQKDEEKFRELLREWGVIPVAVTDVVLNNGLGDHYVFKSVLRDIILREKGKKSFKIVAYCCYPDVFSDMPEVITASIAEAMAYFGDLSRWDVYKFMVDRGWRGTLEDAFRKLYKL